MQIYVNPDDRLDAIIHLAGASKIVDDLPDSHYRTNNVETTKHLREMYPDVPLYLASTTSMYNETKQIEHKHFGLFSVNGKSLVPRPPANITPCVFISGSLYSLWRCPVLSMA